MVCCLALFFNKCPQLSSCDEIVFLAKLEDEKTYLDPHTCCLSVALSVYLCTVSVATPPLSSRFCVLWRTVVAAPPTNAENAKQK